MNNTVLMKRIDIQLPLRAKLLISFLVVLAISGIVSTWMGVRLIGEGIIHQVQDKVRVDLNSARQIYLNRLSDVEDVVRMTASRFFVKQGLRSGNTRSMRDELDRVRLGESLDILTLTDSAGRVLFRTRNPSGPTGEVPLYDLVYAVLASRSEVRRGQWEPFIPGPLEVIAMGSVAYKLARVSAGLNDATFTLVPKNEWDIAAGVGLIEFAGGRVTDTRGEAFTFNNRTTLIPGLLASGEPLFDLLTDHAHTMCPQNP